MANSQRITFGEAIKQVRTEYLKAKQELERLKEKLKEISNKSTATLAISLEAEPRHSQVNQEVNVDKNEHELAQELLSESSEYITEIEKGTDELIKEAEAKGAIEIVSEAKIVRKKFRSRMLKVSAILLLAFSQQIADKPPPTEAFTDKDKAKVELRSNGITSFQKRRYIPGVSDLVFRAFNDADYELEKKKKDIIPNLLYGKNRNGMVGTTFDWNGSEDAWRLYLGLSQKNDTFGISDYQPTKSKNKDNKYYYKLNNYFKKTYGLDDNEKIQELLGNAMAQEKFGIDKLFNNDSVMGNHILTTGQDERGLYISYYDIWNLEMTPEGERGVIGKPFEIYDRIYYKVSKDSKGEDFYEIIEPK